MQRLKYWLNKETCQMCLSMRFNFTLPSSLIETLCFCQESRPAFEQFLKHSHVILVALSGRLAILVPRFLFMQFPTENCR